MKQKRSCLIIIILMMVILGGLIKFQCFNMYNLLNADMAAELILAKQLASESGFLSTNWYYSTEIRVINTQIISMLLFKITSNWQLVRFFTNIFLYVICAVSFAFLGKSMELDNKSIIISELLLLVPFSSKYLELLQFGGFYYPHVILSFLAMGAYFRCLQRKRYLFIWCLLSFFMGAGGLRYLLVFHIPAFCAGVLYLVIWNRFEELIRLILSAGRNRIYVTRELSKVLKLWPGCLCAGLGYLFNVIILEKHYVFDKHRELIYRKVGEDGESIVDLLGKTLMGIPEVMGFRYEAKLFSVHGAFNAAVLAIAIGIATAIVYKLKKLALKREKTNYPQQFLLLLFIFSFLANLYIFVFVGNSYTSRYWIVVIQFLIPFFACWMTECNRGAAQRNAMYWGGVFVVFSMTAGILTLHEATRYNRNIHRYGVNQFLVQRDLEVGYSTFWNANITTEMTNGKVKVLPIKGPADFTLYKYLTPMDSYSKERQCVSDVFVLLERGELEEALQSQVYTAGKEVYIDESYVVYKFDRAYMDGIVKDLGN